MTEELKKEGMELINKLSSELESIDSNLEKLAILGCDCHNVMLVNDTIRMAKRTKKIETILEFYKRPIAWKD